MLTLWEAPSQGSLTRLPRLQVQGPPRLVEDRRRLDGEEGQRFLRFFRFKVRGLGFLSVLS